MSEYHKPDLSKLTYDNNRPTYDEVLNETVPYEVGDDVISGKKEVKITKAEKDYENKCVKLEISC